MELPGCHTQALSYDELIKRTKEAIELYLDVKNDYEPLNQFVGLLPPKSPVGGLFDNF